MAEEVDLVDIVQNLESGFNYSVNQKKFISDHYGITPLGNEILVTRSQVDASLPTARRSCCLVSPNGQNSFYGPTGFVFGVGSDMIPWVSDGDSGTSKTSKDLLKPKETMTIGEYMNKANSVGKYSETEIDFQYGKADCVRAVYDLRRLPPEPGVATKLIFRKKYKEIVDKRRYILETRTEWRKIADYLNVPFITELPDKEIVENLRKEEDRVDNELLSTNFN